MKRNKPLHLRSLVTSCTWYSLVEWLGSANNVSCHIHTEEQSDIHNLVLSEAQNISLLLRFLWELLLNPPPSPKPPALLFYFSPLVLPLFSVNVFSLTIWWALSNTRLCIQSGIYLNLRTGPTGHATLFNQWEGALVFINKQIKSSPQWSKIFKTADGAGQN